jgi:hypothetical protein
MRIMPAYHTMVVKTLVDASHRRSHAAFLDSTLHVRTEARTSQGRVPMAPLTH